MSAGLYNIYLEQGAAFHKQITVRYANRLPFDLTDYDVKMQIRPDFDGPLTLNLTGTDYFPANDLPNGRFVLHIGADITALMAAGNYKYDLVLFNTTDATDIFRLLQGKVIVNPRITI